MSNDLFANLKGVAAPATEPVEQPAPEVEVAEEEASDIVLPDQLTVLKQRAQLMGIKFSNNISLETLKAKIAAKLASEAKAAEPEEQDEEAVEPEEEAPVSEVATAPVVTPAAPKKSKRQEQLDEQMRLVRCRITNLDPKKATLHGEIFTVANDFIGTVKKFIPYGEVTDNGYHIPFILYQNLIERTFVSIKVKKVRDKPGQTYVETQDVREFAIEVLPNLTAQELAQLAAAQAAAGGL